MYYKIKITNEKIGEFWRQHIDESIKYGSMSPRDYFSQHICRICEYWYPLNEDILHKISKYYPDIFEYMCRGIVGKMTSSITFDDGRRDVYTSQLFYGFCKRYPPVVGQDDSFVNIGLFSVKK